MSLWSVSLCVHCVILWLWMYSVIWHVWFDILNQFVLNQCCRTVTLLVVEPAIRRTKTTTRLSAFVISSIPSEDWTESNKKMNLYHPCLCAYMHLQHRYLWITCNVLWGHVNVRIWWDRTRKVYLYQVTRLSCNILLYCIQVSFYVTAWNYS